ncbi:conjugal transfer protein TrbJ [Synergistales bacterium]|nr:conjugal transfer protein TrbJ [Synergistales bacterium]
MPRSLEPKNRMKTIKLQGVAILLALVIGLAEIAFAGGGASGGAREWTQRMNNAELVEAVRKANEQIRNQIEQLTHEITMITNQITMIEDMIMNTLTLPAQLFGDTMNSVLGIKRVLEKTMGIAYSLQDIDSVFKDRFRSAAMYGSSGYSAYDYEREYEKIQETQMETIRSSMEAIGVVYDQYTSDSELLSQLQEKAMSANGRNQILQAGNQLSSFSASQLLRLEELSLMQINNYNTVAEAERAKEDMGRVLRKKLYETEGFVPDYAPFTLGGQ